MCVCVCVCVRTCVWFCVCVCVCARVVHSKRPTAQMCTDSPWIKKACTPRSSALRPKPIATARLADFVERRKHQVGHGINRQLTTLVYSWLQATNEYQQSWAPFPRWNDFCFEVCVLNIQLFHLCTNTVRRKEISYSVLQIGLSLGSYSFKP